MAEEILDLQFCLFVVDERPVCLWDEDINRQNKKFLDRIDSSYFDYLYGIHAHVVNNATDLTDKDVQHSALAMRTAYSQALETLFALLGAAIQAYWCVPGWINSYTNTELYRLIGKIQNNLPVMSALELESPKWCDIFHFLFSSLALLDEQQATTMEADFAKIWTYLATDFLDEAFAREFNSIKHGLRVGSGGFKLCIGIPDKPGVPPPQENMVDVSSSDFGSSYFRSHKIGDPKHHIYIRDELRNWDLGSIAWGLQQAARSIKNIQSALRAINGFSSEFEFIASQSEDFGLWKGFDTMSEPKMPISPEYIDFFAKDDILANYNSKQYIGTKRLIFGGSDD
jgi:hypothetical protein